MSLETQILRADEVERGAEILRGGGVLGFATETVYGLGADARNGKAVAAVYAAKGRPAFNPLIVHVPDLETAQEYAVFSLLALRLAHAFWPGPLSLVLPLRRDAGLSSLVTAGLDTVALRVPAHAGARALLSAFGGPVAAPSANPSGGVSPTRLPHVVDGLGGKIDAVIAGGDCGVGVESTILLVNETVALLRAGGVCVEEIEAVLGHEIARPHDPVAPQSPGQLATHYAPDVAVRINASKAFADEIFIGFGPVSAEMNLSPTGNLHEAAANLFAFLRAADRIAKASGKTIAVSAVPITGLGLAINDRLIRAAADRR
jgi:L-threonylcarbamoyladenylate synthase